MVIKYIHSIQRRVSLHSGIPEKSCLENKQTSNQIQQLAPPPQKSSNNQNILIKWQTTIPITVPCAVNFQDGKFHLLSQNGKDPQRLVCWAWGLHGETQHFGFLYLELPWLWQPTGVLSRVSFPDQSFSVYLRPSGHKLCFIPSIIHYNSLE